MKTARQWFRAVKNFGAGDETKVSRRDFTRYRQAERNNNAPWWLSRRFPFLYQDEPALEPWEPTEAGE